MPHIRSVIARSPQLLAVLMTYMLVANAAATTIDYQGYAFETGGFPPGSPGDTLRIPFVVTSSSLNVDLATTELTGWIDGLVSSGMQDGGDAVHFFTFSTGTIEIWRDDARDAGFGTAPPNASVPGSFRNGSLCLTGSLSDFVLYLDTDTGAGAYEGTVDFTGGPCLTELGAGSAEGYTFGGVLTREVTSNIPEGFDFSVDGFLEAQKKPVAGCDFECMALTSARLDFPRREPRNFGPKDGKFDIEGVFLPCAETPDFDPSTLELRVRIGSYVQVLPEGALEPDGSREWRFSNFRGVETLTKVEFEANRNGLWEFELKGRGIPRSTLLPEDNLLEVELTLGTMSGVDDGVLVQRRYYLRFRDHDCDCRPPGGDDDDDAPGLLAQEPAASAALAGATPNPFNATTTIRLRTSIAGPAAVSIFDARGRRVRNLQSGGLAAGDHRFVWDGRDDHGATMPSGIFFYRVDAPGIATSRKLVMAK